jgi:endonuclease YncB( thermonuclease family)
MKKPILILSLACCLAAPAFAQVAPPPHRSPRTPVDRQALADRRAAVPHDVTGPALILDGEKLRIGETELRLFGIVPPQLSASFGPQARAVLDALLAGQNVACHIRDRDHDGRLLATCRAANGVDPALDLLRRGLAVAARGSIADTEYAQPYVAAEQAAQSQKIGLWSVAIAAPAAVSAAVLEAPKAEAFKVEAPKAEPAKAEAPKIDAPKVDSSAAKIAETQPKTAAAIIAPAKAAANVVVKSAVPDETKAVAEGPGIFARFQILISGILMLATALGILGALSLHRRAEKRDEMKALAAALRGELLAARAVCLTRIKNITTEQEDRSASWPRIRSTLYQAYVGRLGWLGAALARQVASIYGQASDYSSYYNSVGETSDAAGMPKRQALQALAAHIEEVLPRLAVLEQTGQKASPNLVASAQMHATPVVETQPESAPVVTLPPPVAPKTAAAQPAAAPGIESKLWDVVRNLRERFAEPQHAVSPPVEPANDYTSLIEEDMEHLSFSGDDDEAAPFGKMGGH